MTAVAELQSCDGFSVEGADGLLGWVEETWLDDSGHPAALAVRTSDGRRALLALEAVRAVDADTQQVIVARPRLQELDAPRIVNTDRTLAASWRTTGALVVAPGAAAAPPPAVAASRAAGAHRERPLWQIVAFMLGCLAGLVAFLIGLDFLVAYLVTGRAY